MFIINDLINYLIEFLNDKESYKMLRLNIYINNELKKKGFLKNLNFISWKNRYYDFITNCNKHKNTLNKIRVDGLRNPTLWVPLYVPIMEMIEISADFYLNPVFSLVTEDLTIRCERSNTMLRVNWEKFKKIKKIDIRASKLNILELFEKCKILKKFSIGLEYCNRKVREYIDKRFRTTKKLIYYKFSNKRKRVLILLINSK